MLLLPRTALDCGGDHTAPCHCPPALISFPKHSCSFFIIGPGDMFLEIFLLLLLTLHPSTLTQARSWALPSFHNLLGFISVRIFATLFKWFSHLCICDQKTKVCVPRPLHSLGIYQMLSQDLMKEQLELEWLSLYVRHYMPGTPLRTLNV